MGTRTRVKASKETAKVALASFQVIVGSLGATEALARANDIRCVGEFIKQSHAKLPSNAAYDRDRIRRFTGQQQH